MRSAVRSRPRVVIVALVAAVTVTAAPLFSADFTPDYHPDAYAITGAKVVAGPDSVLDPGTVVVRRGVIEAVGPAGKVAVPYDAETIDGKGLVVYPGFLDLYSSLGQPAGAVRSQTGPGRAVNYAEHALARTPPDNRNGLTPEFEVAKVLELPEAVTEEFRKLGFTDLLCAPAGAIATGQSVLAALSGLPRREAVVRAPVALHINLRPPYVPEPPPAHDDDTAAKRGASAHARPYPQALMGAVAHLRQAMLDAAYQHQVEAASAKAGGTPPPFDPALQALYAARTRALPIWWEANTRDEILRALDLAEEFGTTAVIVGGREAARVADRLKARKVPVVLRLDFPEEPRVPTEAEYRKRDLADREEPLRILQDRAAKWKERVATAAALARAGVPFAFSAEGLSKPETFHAQVRKLIAAGLPRAAAVAALTHHAAEIAGVGARLGTIEPGKLGHLVVLSAPYGDESARVRYILADGLKFDLDRSRKADPERKARKDEPRPAPVKGKGKPDEASKPGPARPEEKPEVKTPEDREPEPFVDVSTEFAEDRKPKLKTGGNVLIKGAVILTVTNGTIPRGSILVRDGKIAEVGETVRAPKDVPVIDATGMVVMPGIVDSHSHLAIRGSVNEYSLSITPEVRIRDVLDGEDPGLYRALAGGTTTARVLHGSANTIGGQDAVIKLKYGLPGRDLQVKGAGRGVKFALGENVTREGGRFPNTRMGIEATIERAFEEARAYQAQWQAYEAKKARDPAAFPPRRDLRLEALAGVLDGSLTIHCHCYRSDEILMLLRVAARHGVRVRSLQHALEGYKVAPEIAASGVSVSTFSDWWGFKVEAYDAIPYNAALLTRAGAPVCIKSDSEELVRHLYLEAAKMVKYGDVTEAQALAMITINPAREIGVAHRVGSIEKGKDADLAIFNAHPFDAFARCELTLIDGEVWFQRPSRDGKLTPRPGAHAALPAPSPGVTARALEIQNNPKGVYALVGATIHPVAGDDIRDGILVISEGKIAAVGGPETRIPGAAQTVDVRGFDLWPGLIDAGTPLGLFEIGSLAETLDFADGAQFQPELRTSTALRADSELIPVTRANGVLTAYVHPLGGLIAGQGCAIDLNGWVPRELVLADPLALHVRIPPFLAPEPDAPRARQADRAERRQKRRERLDAIAEEFRRALAYDRVRAEAARREAPPPLPDPRLDALVPYARGERPVIFHADHRGEILEALQLAEALKLKAIISGGADAWKVTDALKAAKAPVLICGTLQLPTEAADPYDARYANPRRLHEAGIPFAIRSKDSGPDLSTAARNLPYEAATAVAFGLPEAEALKAVTLAPARILGIADQVGSLEVGKRANLVITAGHVLQPTTKVKALFINGKPLTPESRHTRLFDKYLQRLAEVQAGTAPLGIEPRPVPVAAPVPTGEAPSTPAGQR